MIFLVQEKVAGTNMPLDDTIVIWSETESPFIPIARVNIPPQEFTNQNQQNFSENLSMNPWHGVGKWQPLGSLNRARRLVYIAVSAYRHEQNGVPRVEPDSWCFGQNEQCDLDQYFHKTKPEWPLSKAFDPQWKPISDK